MVGRLGYGGLVLLLLVGQLMAATSDSSSSYRHLRYSIYIHLEITIYRKFPPFSHSGAVMLSGSGSVNAVQHGVKDTKKRFCYVVSN
jgi:hypothetical protein